LYVSCSLFSRSVLRPLVDLLTEDSDSPISPSSSDSSDSWSSSSTTSGVPFELSAAYLSLALDAWEPLSGDFGLWTATS